MTTTGSRKFSFDTEFDGDGATTSAPPRKTLFTAREVDQVRAEALAEGRAAAAAEAEQLQARCLEDIRQAIGRALGTLAQAAHDHRVGAAELAMAAARKIADAALERFPEAPAQAALDALQREIEGHPRLLVRAPEAIAAKVQAALDRAADQAGFTGQVTVKSDPALDGAAFIFEWGEGRAAFDPEEAAARVSAALEAALAAEGLHGEPLIAPEGTADV